jgi:hypothetical protein
MSDPSLFERVRASQITTHGNHAAAARVKDAFIAEATRALSELSMTASTREIADALEKLERDRPNFFRSWGQQDEHLHDVAQKQAAKTVAVFGIAPKDFVRMTAAERLAVANSKGKTLPAWYKIEKRIK